QQASHHSHAKRAVALHSHEEDSYVERSQYRDLHGGVPAHHDGVQKSAKGLRDYSGSLLRNVERRWIEGGVSRHRFEDLAAAVNELTRKISRGSHGAPATAPPFFCVQPCN